MNINEKIFESVLNEVCLNTRIMESQKFIQHGTTTVLEHSMAVAYLSCIIADTFSMNVDKEKMVRGALLHDYFLYDWHEKNAGHKLHGFKHPYIALKNAKRDCQLSPLEEDIIVKHMFPLTPKPPKYSESFIVSLADKICSTYETCHISSKFKMYGKSKACFVSWRDSLVEE